MIALLALGLGALLAIVRRPRLHPRGPADRVPIAPELARVLRDVERHWTRAGHPRPAWRGLREHLDVLPEGALTADARAVSRRVVEAVYESAFAGRPPAPGALDVLSAASRGLSG